MNWMKPSPLHSVWLSVVHVKVELMCFQVNVLVPLMKQLLQNTSCAPHFFSSLLLFTSFHFWIKLLQPAEGVLTTHRRWDLVQKPYCSSLVQCCTSSTWPHREINLIEYCLIRNWKRTDPSARLSQSARVLQTILRLAREHFHPLMPTRLHKIHPHITFTASHPAGLKRRWGNVPTWTDMLDSPECRMSHVWCVTHSCTRSVTGLNTHEAN